MKKFFSLTIIMVAALMLNGCSNYPKTPTEMAQKVLEAIDKNDTEELEKYFTLIVSGRFYDFDDPDHPTIKDDFSGIKNFRSAIEYNPHLNGNILPISDYEFLMEELSEDGQQALVWYLPKERISDEMKETISAYQWKNKYYHPIFIGDRIRVRLAKNPDGKWKALIR